MNSKEYLEKIINSYLYNNVFSYSLNIKLHDTVIEVKTNNAGLKDSLEKYFKYYITDTETPDISITAIEAPAPDFSPLNLIKKEPDKGKNRIKEEYININGGRLVRKLLTGMVFYFDGKRNLAIGPALINSNQIVNFINNRYIEKKLKDGCRLFHSSAVTCEDKGVAISGFSGMGKSTLALKMLDKGFKFVSNDRLLVGRDREKLMMYGVAKYPRINPGTIINNKRISGILSEEEIQEYVSLSFEDLWKTEKKYDFFIEDIYGEGTFKVASTMSTLIVLNWDHKNNEKTSLAEVDLKDRIILFSAFTKQPGLFYLEKKEREVANSNKEYLELLSDCRVFEVTGNINFEVLAAKVVDIVR